MLSERDRQRRYRVLEDCLELVEALKRTFSRNNASQAARDGDQQAFDEMEHRRQVLQEMMSELRYGKGGGA